MTSRLSGEKPLSGLKSTCTLSIPSARVMLSRQCHKNSGRLQQGSTTMSLLPGRCGRSPREAFLTACRNLRQTRNCLNMARIRGEWNTRRPWVLRAVYPVLLPRLSRAYSADYRLHLLDQKTRQAQWPRLGSVAKWPIAPVLSPEAGGYVCAAGFDPLPRLVNLRSRSEEHTSELQSLRHLVCR